ncbi:hypothetical protein DUZ99_12010 [Xylanibacillus composti]|uniref:DUF3298 domain-containing protein n=1 Tax=Xylanibacillus composti TaxID=1572762 RepID=A0A8J4H552_9BACL|nr:hypothetical protein [Xylanibacillus composti]MDT9725698.1 hypothetical protein [Xylanibacillus composti]GIQ71162.1 hypothetical protein XYCOK13_39860 [Xylanibacillus composti]
MSGIKYRLGGLLLSFLLLCSGTATHTSGTALLPSGFTLQNIQTALEQYINDRLWFYPTEVRGSPTDKNFDPYIGRTLEVEVRVYDDGSGDKQVYAQTSAGEWLVRFMIQQGIVYSEGQVGPGEDHYPQGNYMAVGSFTIEIQEAHPPNYGMSPRKEKMIIAIEETAKAVCEDLERGTESGIWSGTEVYMADFYEYEEAGALWLVRFDGYALYMPIEIVEEYNSFTTVLGKGYGLNNVYELDQNDPGRFMFDRQTQDAVRKTRCDF